MNDRLKFNGVILKDLPEKRHEPIALREHQRLLQVIFNTHPNDRITFEYGQDSLNERLDHRRIVKELLCILPCIVECLLGKRSQVALCVRNLNFFLVIRSKRLGNDRLRLQPYVL